jgi:hypothetical protein
MRRTQEDIYLEDNYQAIWDNSSYLPTLSPDIFFAYKY